MEYRNIGILEYCKMEYWNNRGKGNWNNGIVE